MLNVAKQDFQIAPGKAEHPGDLAFIGSGSNQGDDQLRMTPQGVRELGLGGVAAVGLPGVAQVDEVRDRTSTPGRRGAAARGTTPRSSAR